MKKKRLGKIRAAAVLAVCAGFMLRTPAPAYAAEDVPQQTEAANEAGLTGAITDPAQAALRWLQTENGRMYLGADGSPQIGWIQDNGHWYYLDDSGIMATGWRKVDGKYYFLRADGTMENGSFKENETVYAFSGDGSLLSAKKAKNTGGGGFDVGFYNKECQDLANNLNELKSDAFDGDEDDDYYEDDKVDYDKDASFVISGRLTQIAEHRLEEALSKGYGNGKIPGEGELNDYIKSIRYNTGRRFLEVYMKNCDDSDDAMNKLLRGHSEEEKKRRDQAVYYKEVGIAQQVVGGKNYYMAIFMR